MEPDDPPRKAIIMVGNIIDGLEVYGPFDDMQYACEWAAQNFDDEWLSVYLTDPADLETTPS